MHFYDTPQNKGFTAVSYKQKQVCGSVASSSLCHLSLYLEVFPSLSSVCRMLSQHIAHIHSSALDQLMHLLSVSQCVYWGRSAVWNWARCCWLSETPAGVHLWSHWKANPAPCLEPISAGPWQPDWSLYKNNGCQGRRAFGRLYAGGLEK